MTTTSQPGQALPRLIVNPVVERYGKRWWVPREDLITFDHWMRANGFWAVRYRNAAGHLIELTRGGLVRATGGAAWDLVESLAVENHASGVDVCTIKNQRRAEMNRM